MEVTAGLAAGVVAAGVAEDFSPGWPVAVLGAVMKYPPTMARTARPLLAALRRCAVVVVEIGSRLSAAPGDFQGIPPALGRWQINGQRGQICAKPLELELSRMGPISSYSRSMDLPRMRASVAMGAWRHCPEDAV